MTNKKHYFTQVNEDAIIEYIKSKDSVIRTDLYVRLIEPVFSEMVNKIIFTYKFTNLPDINSLREECKIWLVTILDKFEPQKGYKAFSYFSVITKNWFIHEVKKTADRFKREKDFINQNSHKTSYDCDDSEGDKKYLESRENKEFWELLKMEMLDWDCELEDECCDSERKVLNAIQILLEHIEEVEIFNKKAFYLYLRELTGFSTKQIVTHLNHLRKKYKEFKKDWDDGEI